jgi:hypothetical protein
MISNVTVCMVMMDVCNTPACKATGNKVWHGDEW